jgi:hypothetical protein
MSPKRQKTVRKGCGKATENWENDIGQQTEEEFFAQAQHTIKPAMSKYENMFRAERGC